MLTENFACFRDETRFNGKRVRLYKRAQILVADLWACFDGEDFGEFNDIDKITMFAGEYSQSIRFLSQPFLPALSDFAVQIIAFRKCSTNLAVFASLHHWKITSETGS